ncbi:MAG: transposase family protein, partial [Chloroflexota bacterium]|nr:transposase family protein [Chloroflexota bacterium]
MPDPRHARGKQLEWTMILGVIASAILCQHRSVTAIADWVHAQRATLLAAFRPVRNRLPSESTLRRALRRVNLAALEQHLCAMAPHPAPAPAPTNLDTVEAYAVDGKYARGAGAHGHPVLLVSLVQHASAQVLGQTAVPDKQHESRGVA